MGWLPGWPSCHPSDGHCFYERPLWAGAFLNEILALETLADPTSGVLGDARVSGRIIADDVKQLAGTTQFGSDKAPDPFNPIPDGLPVSCPACVYMVRCAGQLEEERR